MTRYVLWCRGGRALFRRWLFGLAAVAVVVLPVGVWLFLNYWGLAMDGAAEICLERGRGEASVSTPREGLLGFRCMYGDGEVRGSKVWIWDHP